MAQFHQSDVRPTRIAAIGYTQTPAGWVFVDRETLNQVGEIYPTRAELLADVDGYARRGGWVKDAAA